MGRTPNIPRALKNRPFTLAEGLAAGLTQESLRSNCWRRLGSQLYCWNGWEVNHWGLLTAWKRRLPGNAIFAGFTAAWLHGLDVQPCPVEVVVPPTSGLRSRSGLVVHRTKVSEMTMARGLPVTTIRRTFRDLRTRLSSVEYLVLADEALLKRLGRFDDRAAPAESPMETRLRWLISQVGLPKPQVQKELRDADGRFVGRADLYFPSARLAIEYDGVNHRNRLIEDNRRQNMMVSAGFKLLRFTAADLEAPQQIASQIRAALFGAGTV